MITKKEWDKANKSKSALSILIAKETEKYLKDGGIITRKESEDNYIYLEAPDGKTLKQVKTK